MKKLTAAEIIQRERETRAVDGNLPHIGSVLIDLSTQYRLSGSGVYEENRREIQDAITELSRTDDDAFYAYIGILPTQEQSTTYFALNPLRVVAPFVADREVRKGIIEQHQMLKTYSKRLWDLRKDPLVLIRRYNFVDRKKTCLNTFSVRLSRTENRSAENEADLYVIGLHGNGAYAHPMLGNVLSVGTTLIKKSQAPINSLEIICFDYRGSVASPGTHEGIEDLADQAIDMVQDVLQRGISPDKIILHGHSLGGLVGVMAANKLMKAGHQIHYFGDRPPNSISDAAEATAKSFSSLLAAPARFVGKQVFSAYQCDASTLYLELPRTHRGCLAASKDEVVNINGSLVGILRSRHKNEEGIIVDEIYHMTPLGNIGLYSGNLKGDQNPFYLFLLERASRAASDLEKRDVIDCNSYERATNYLDFTGADANRLGSSLI